MMAIGVMLAVLSGTMLGAFALPMKKIRVWEWEHTWLVFSVAALIVLPFAAALATVPDLFAVWAETPPRVVFAVAGFAALWGIASMGYGIAVKLAGIAIANAVILGLNNAIGSILPIVVYTPEKLRTASGMGVAGGVLAMLAGIALCARAGYRRDRRRAIEGPAPGLAEAGRSEGTVKAGSEGGGDGEYGVAGGPIARSDEARGETGDTPARSRALEGLIICLAAGILGSSFTFALVSGKPIEAIAAAHGASATYAPNAIWPVALLSGCLVAILYCGFLMVRKKNFRSFVATGTRTNWLRAAVMAVLWYGGVMIYGIASNRLGDLGVSVGWAVLQSMTVATGAVVGFLTGEWKAAGRKIVRQLVAGLVLLVLGIVIVVIGGTL
jgi:L-rhamnose-H+ transport protein